MIVTAPVTGNRLRQIFESRYTRSEQRNFSSMATAANFDQERSELQSVLASGIFDRAPSLAQLLTYVCSKYFEGESEQIKEYSIGVEALGRGAEFDPKRDSIVRVEAHRLRKRLRDYYCKEGIGHAVHIVIPPGHYTPKFLPRE